MERRKFERVPLHTTVVVINEAGASLIGEAADLSIGGMFLEGVSLAFGERVVVQVCLGGAGRIVALPGVVRWTRETGVGIQFGLLGAVETHDITESLARAAPSRTRDRVSTVPAIDDDINVEVG